MKLFLITVALLGLGIAGIAIKIWAKKDGKFAGIVIIQAVFYIFFFGKFAFSKQKKETTKNIAVSVIICAKNESENLKKLLPSVIAQDYPEFEIVLINDDSKDDTLEVMGYHLWVLVEIWRILKKNFLMLMGLSAILKYALVMMTCLSIKLPIKRTLVLIFLEIVLPPLYPKAHLQLGLSKRDATYQQPLITNGCIKYY